MNISTNFNPSSILKTRRQSFGLRTLLFLTVFGVLFSAGGIIGLQQSKIDPTWAKTQGKIVSASSSINNGSTTYAPVVQYSVNNQSYRISSSYSSSSYPSIGQSRSVAYNPMQPEQAKIVETAGTTWWLYIFPIVGIGMIVIGFVAYVRSIKRNNKINRLIQSGRKVQGVLTDIQNIGGNNSTNTYKIIVSATDTNGVVQNYVSDTIGGIGEMAMADFRNNPIPIDVYIDPVDPENYYVDIADIPNLTPDRIKQLITLATQNNSITPPVSNVGIPNQPSESNDPSRPVIH